MPKYTSEPVTVQPLVTAGSAASAGPHGIIEWTPQGASYTTTTNYGGKMYYNPALSTNPIPAGRGRG